MATEDSVSKRGKMNREGWWQFEDSVNIELEERGTDRVCTKCLIPAHFGADLCSIRAFRSLGNAWITGRSECFQMKTPE